MKFKLSTITIILTVLLFGCGKKDSTEQLKTVQDIQKDEGIPVTVEKVGFGTIKRVERGNGTLQGISEATLANGMGGTLKKINVSVGQKVKKNAIVAVMEIDGGSPVIVAKSAYEYASKAYDRAQKLFEEGAVSQEQLDGARVQYENSKRQLGQSRVGVNVYSPFSGTILEIMESAGSKISKETPVVKIADLRKMRVQMQINEKMINLFSKGQKAFTVIENDTVYGNIDRVALSANGMAHSFRVTVILNNTKSLLKPGMFKNIDVIVEEKDNALYLPIEIVNYDTEGNPYVFIAKNDKAHKTFVTTGIRNAIYYEILEGITKDDTVVTTGITKLSDDVKIKIVKE